jgi:hypothetical protein
MEGVEATDLEYGLSALVVLFGSAGVVKLVSCTADVSPAVFITGRLACTTSEPEVVVEAADGAPGGVVATADEPGGVVAIGVKDDTGAGVVVPDIVCAGTGCAGRFDGEALQFGVRLSE